jgi:hypothetical protein
VAGLAATAFGCAGLFGIDEPTRDPCAAGGCEDAEPIVDATAPDAATDAIAADSAVDSVADHAAPTGLRCGDRDASYCTVPSFCCQTPDDAGALYTCVFNACAGYPIECATAKDCAAGNVCCHFHSGIKCVPPQACSGETVCDPSGADCPAGKACDVPLINADRPSPYLGCAP